MRIQLYSSSILIVLFFSSCGITKHEFEQLQNEKDQLHAQILSLQSHLDEQDQKINTLEKVYSSMEQDKEAFNSNISSLQENITNTQAQVQQVEFNLREKQYQINQLWNELDGAFSEVETAVSATNQKIKNLEEFLYLDLNDGVNFGSGSDEIDPEDNAQLEKLATLLIQNPKITMMIEGHTDQEILKEGEEGYRDNWDLSVSRATQVIRKFEALGVNPKQLVAAGRGEHSPNSSAHPNDKAAQRRTEFIIVPNVGKLYKMHKDMKQVGDQSP